MVAQTSITIVMMRKSFTGHSTEYLSTVAILSTEVLKLLFSAVLLRAELGSTNALIKTIYYRYILQWRSLLATAIPALIYTIQNNLIYVGGEHLEATVQQMTQQLKIITTAILSVLFLGRRLSGLQWLSLVLLMAGVIIANTKSIGNDDTIEWTLVGTGCSHCDQISLPNDVAIHAMMDCQEACATNPSCGFFSWSTRKPDTEVSACMMSESCQLPMAGKDVCEVDDVVQLFSSPGLGKILASGKLANPTIGVLAVVLATVCSGFAAVYIEKMLKQDDVSLWLRNMQLATFSALFSGFAIYSKDKKKVNEAGLFQGFSLTVWTIVILQSFGGLFVASVTKYLDSIIKNFASSISIVSTGFLSLLVLDDSALGWNYFLGSSIIITATLSYSYAQKVAEPQTVNLEQQKPQHSDDVEAGQPTIVKGSPANRSSK
jgi:UDP-sugar transporter A1/2/3